VTGKRIMYLANHRSWADFAVDSVLTNGGSYLARYGIIFGVPMSGLWGWISGKGNPHQPAHPTNCSPRLGLLLQPKEGH